MNELGLVFEIVVGLRNELVPLVNNAVVEDNFDRCISLIEGELEKLKNPEIRMALLEGKVEAFETSLNAFIRGN